MISRRRSHSLRVCASAERLRRTLGRQSFQAFINAAFANIIRRLSRPILARNECGSLKDLQEDEESNLE